jgi:tRNA A37 threonylcarbamoyladenosine biosynthesis protein TsaE
MPIFNQIIENNYINLYKLIQKYKNLTVCAIHTDSIQFKSSYAISPVENSTDVGGVKNELPQDIRNTEIYHPYSGDKLRIKFKKFKTVKEEDISGNTDDLLHLIEQKGSILIEGDAGCGKTYLINKFKERLDMDGKKHMSLAFTNIASRKINGQTFHKAFALKVDDKENKIDAKLLLRLKGKDYLFIDEISMVNTEILAILCTIREKYKDLNIIAVGDFKQLPSPNCSCLENCSAWIDICKANKLTLTIPKRNEDKEFHRNALRVYKKGKINKKDYGNFDIEECKRHIVYTNKKREEINKSIMNKAVKKVKNYTTIPKNINNQYSQDTIIYEGLPIMCVMNDIDSGLINGQEHTVKSFDNDKIYCEDGLEILIKDFALYFVPAYAITYYKCQGSTYDYKFAIHQSDHFRVCRRCLYTAVTRCTNKNNILII